MEVVPLSLPRSNSPNRSVDLPFNRRNVEEWSRLDKLTGIMETAKIETDHWMAMSNNAAHNYGKMIDSRERNNPDGSLQEKKRKQMEVFQSKVPGGSIQVIRTQTITTSSKKWTSTGEKGFEDLQLPVNSLDLSSQKTKGSVGRSGSIGGRRPPSRPRSLISQSSNPNAFGEVSTEYGLHQRLRSEAPKEVYKGFSDFTNFNKELNLESEKKSEHSRIETNGTNDSCNEDFRKCSLTRQKSCSNENLAVETENENTLRRSSKVRRSLQLHKQNAQFSGSNLVEDFDWSTTKSLKERAAEIENLLKRSSSNYTPQIRERPVESIGKLKSLKAKDSFVSAQTLKEVRESLKKRSSCENEFRDDGIVTEKDETSPTSKLNCFIYGMESTNETAKKTNINGTGSLESRSSNKNSTNASRSTEWYRRRKSYGFEQVEEPEKFDNFSKNFIDSSTDSGICQSTETMSIPSWNKIFSDTSDTFTKRPLSTIVTVRPEDNKINGQENKTSSLYERAVNSIYLGNNSLLQKEDSKSMKERNLFRYDLSENSSPSETVWNRKSPIGFYKTTDSRENLKSSLRSAKNPWISQLRGTKLVDRNWASDDHEDFDENKRQSDSSDKQSPPFFGKEDGGKSDSDLITQKKSKKVEFCKTEVHFAAESGKFNIVETDGKPPPNDIFRRRRRSSGGSTHLKSLNCLPETKFSDSLVEKKSTVDTESISAKIEAELNELSKIVIEALPQTKEREIKVEVKNSFPSSRLYDVAEESVENENSENLKPKSILKNYRKSFLLGETEDASQPKATGADDQSMNDRHSVSDTTPLWRSTIVLKNKRFFDARKKMEDEKKLYSSDGETELQIRIRNLKKTDSGQRKLWESSNYEDVSESCKRRSLPDDILLKNSLHFLEGNNQKLFVSDSSTPSLSVAERIKKVEELKLNNYSTKINFRSGEMTVIQNGTSNEEKDSGEDRNITSWACQKKLFSARSPNEEKKSLYERPSLTNDSLTTSNPQMKRFSAHDDNTDNQKYQTTRILINFESATKGDSTKRENDSTEKEEKMNSTKTTRRLINSHGSWSSGMKKDLGRYLNDLKSTSLVKETIQVPQDRLQSREEIPKPSKTVHEIIDQFDSWSVRNKNLKERRRKTVPIAYKQPKEYTHSDLEEELKNFTENLDKDFRDIYEEEIGSLQKSKSLKKESPSKIETVVEPVILKRSVNCFSVRSSSDEGSKKSSQLTSSRDNYDTDDSDLLADEEVRSYMSAGQGGSCSETEDAYGSSSSRKSFEDSVLKFKKLESQMKGRKDADSSAIRIQPKTVYSNSMPARGLTSNLQDQPKVASIALKYEDDPLFFKTTPKTYPAILRSRDSNASSNEPGTDTWEKTSNSSSTVSGKPRERVSYLNGLSLSEKYSKNLHRSSNSSLDTISEFNIDKSPSAKPTSSFSRNQSENYFSKVSSESFKRSSKYSTDNSPEVQCKNLRHFEESTKKSNEKESRPKYSLRSGCGNLESSGYRVKSNDNQPTPGSKDPVLRDRKLKERGETDSGILEELKKAANQIMLAVNGYTDQSSSHLSSSEEDDRSRKIIRGKMSNLGTISEGKRVTKTEMRKSITSSTNKKTSNHSSASSLESLAKESTRTTRDSKTSSKQKHGEGGKSVSSRTTRLLQRASSREALMPQPSSSEDIPSYLEQAKKRVVRRQKTSVRAEPLQESKVAVSSRQRTKSKTVESVSAVRTKDRKPQKVKESTNVTKSSRSNCIPEGNRTKLTTRNVAVEKSETETTRRRRSQKLSSKQEQPTSQTHRRKLNAIKKVEENKSLLST